MNIDEIAGEMDITTDDIEKILSDERKLKNGNDD